MTRSSGSWIHRSRRALGLRRWPPPALRGVPSSSPARPCDRPRVLSCGCRLLQGPTGSPCPPPRAPLLGFSTLRRRACFIPARRILDQGGPLGGDPRRLVTVTPLRRVRSRRAMGWIARRPCPFVLSSRGVASRRRWTLARHLSCAWRRPCPQGLVRAALQSLLRRRWSRPLARPRAPFEVPRRRAPLGRSASAMARRRTARRRRAYAPPARRASTSQVIHTVGFGKSPCDCGLLRESRRAREEFRTAVHSMWTSALGSNIDAPSWLPIAQTPAPRR